VPAALAKDHISDCPVMGEAGECIDGDVQACNGVGNCLGTATCLEDKSGYGKCECVGTGLAQAGQGGTAAGAGAGPRVWPALRVSAAWPPAPVASPTATVRRQA